MYIKYDNKSHSFLRLNLQDVKWTNKSRMLTFKSVKSNNLPINALAKKPIPTRTLYKLLILSRLLYLF